ncbi:MAG: hypothetical protein ABIO55_12800 [Ginsengibacter sp.]
MKKINGNFIFKAAMLLSIFTITMAGCKKDSKPDDITSDPGAIRGTPGNPRFNLQFTNGNKADLDLYVQTPNGSILYYGNPTGQFGQLDVDCLCGDCPNGPNENIYWTPGSAPAGTYKVWAEYFEGCDGSGSSSNYTIRIMNNTSIVQTYTGTLSPGNAKSPVYSYSFR